LVVGGPVAHGKDASNGGKGHRLGVVPERRRQVEERRERRPAGQHDRPGVGEQVRPLERGELGQPSPEL
jgi:hypothetical protein